MQTGKAGLHMQTSLRGIANRARQDKEARFGNLCGLLSVDNLRMCFYGLRKNAATGIDGVTFEEYEERLEENLTELVESLKAKRYRAKLVRRRNIPKGGGKMRPLGIPALEDKVVQRACAEILKAIYEEDFLDCSWGYRTGRSPREATRVLETELHRGRYGWVVEADIRGFFNNIDHDWMIKMLEMRVNDRAFTRLIRKWLKAGIMEEDGQVVHPATGTPQGGIISPVLANIYLHYALDLWFDRKVRKACRGACYLIRYADDFVCAFEDREDAENFERQLYERLEKFGLEVSEEKTRTIRFSRFGGKQNGTFCFLGFEYRWVLRQTGKQGVQRRTAPKKKRESIRAFGEWIKEKRHTPLKRLMEMVRSKLRGYWGYYGVRGNLKDLTQVFHNCKRLLYKWLNRRSQRNSYTWTQFMQMLKGFQIPAPRITETGPDPQLSLFA